jgi:WD40 repeat protein
MTLGPAITALAMMDRVGVRGPVGRALVTLGRVLPFFLLLQWYAIHGFAVLEGLARGLPGAWQFSPAALGLPPDGWAMGLPSIYAACVVVLALLYVPSRRFAGVKARHPGDLALLPLIRPFAPPKWRPRPLLAKVTDGVTDRICLQEDYILSRPRHGARGCMRGAAVVPIVRSLLTASLASGFLAAASMGAVAADAMPRVNLEIKPILALDSGGHTGAVPNVMLSAYGDQLVSVSHDKTIRFWDLRSGEPTRVIRPPIGPGFEGRIDAAALSPDGSMLAVAGISAGTAPNDQHILLIDLPEGKVVRRLRGHTATVRTLAFSPDGRLASGSEDRTVRVWDAKQGKPLWAFTGHYGWVFDVAWSPDGRHLLSGSSDHTGHIWAGSNGNVEATLNGHTGEVLSVAWSPDGRTLATGGSDRAIYLWNPDGSPLRGWAGFESHVGMLAFAPDSKRLVLGWGDRQTRFRGAGVLDTADGRMICRYDGHGNTPVCGVFMRDGNLVATGAYDETIHLWNPRDGRTLRVLRSKGKDVFTVGWSPDGKAIAWGNSRITQNGVTTRPLERSFCLAALEFGPTPDNATYILPQDTLPGMTLRHAKNSERILNFRRNGVLMSKLQIPVSNKIRSFTFLPGDRAAVASLGLWIFDVNSGGIIQELPGHTDTIWRVSVSPDWRYLVTGSEDQTMGIWDSSTGEHLLSLFVAGDEWVAWTPQGYYAASLAGEGLMGWHVNNGPDRMSSFYPASRFRKVFYRPDVIRRIIEAGHWKKALDLADLQLARTTKPIELSAALPPTVSISLPKSGDDAPTSDPNASPPRLEAEARPSGAEPITAMKVVIDGRPYGLRQYTPKPVAAGSAKAPDVREAWNLTLTPGRHEVAVKADTARSYSLSEPIEVGKDEPGLAPRGTLYILAIGTSSSFGDGTDPGLDARAVAGALEAQGRGAFAHVESRVLAYGDATQANILGGLEWLKQKMTLADVGVVVFIGQGGADGRGEFRLLASDSGLDPDNGGIAATTVRQAAQSISGRLLFWSATQTIEARRRDQSRYDYCQGKTVNESRGEALSSQAEDALRELATDDVGVAVLGVAVPQPATARPAGSMGAFAAGLVQGLSGRADLDHDGVVQLDELESFVKAGVRGPNGGSPRPVSGRPTLLRPFPLARPKP